MESENTSVTIELPFTLEVSAVLKHVRFRADGRRLEEAASKLTEKVKAVARPRAVYRPARVRHSDGRSIEIGSMKFSSRVLKQVLKEQDVAFPYIITIGPELAELNESDMLRRFWLDKIKEMVLHSAGRSFSDYLHKKSTAARLTHINPGEIDDWPITEQKPLFALFGGVEKEIGVTLTSGCVIKPIKSRSGIFFANDTGFETCRLCHQTKCPGRRAAYDATVVAEYTAD